MNLHARRVVARLKRRVIEKGRRVTQHPAEPKTFDRHVAANGLHLRLLADADAGSARGALRLSLACFDAQHQNHSKNAIDFIIRTFKLFC